ncbi:MAG: ABC transporter permease [Sedimentisphaerales bacterium]|nr:ABC transporter permease [Sedimentisphaerales bacterium]
MLKLFLCLRYLRKLKLVFLSVAALGLSVGLLVIVASLFSGYIEAIRLTGHEVYGDVYLKPWIEIPECGALIDALESLEEVKAATVVTESYGLLYLGRGNVKGVKVLGIDPDSYSKFYDLENRLLKYRHSSEGRNFGSDFAGKKGYISIGVLTRPDEKTDVYDFDIARQWLGKEVVFTTGAVVKKPTAVRSPEDNNNVEVVPGTPYGERLRTRTLKFKVSGIVHHGIYFIDNSVVYLPIETVRQLHSVQQSKYGGGQGAVKIRLFEGTEPRDAIESVRRVWQKSANQWGLDKHLIANTLLLTADDIQHAFLAEVHKQKVILMLIFTIICSAVVLLIFCIIYMIVISKQKDIAIIKSCGVANSSVASIFVGFGGFVGIAGSALGVLLGAVVTRNINLIEYWIRVALGLKLWKSSAYVFDKIPARIDTAMTLWVVVFAIIAACIGALIPAILAVRTRPIDILRYE